MAVNAEAPASRANSARVAVQKFGTFLSGMIMPNIAAFIAWGIITALFIEKGPFPIEGIGGFGKDATGAPITLGLVQAIIRFMLPLLIANTGGRMVYGVRGGKGKGVRHKLLTGINRRLLAGMLPGATARAGEYAAQNGRRARVPVQCTAPHPPDVTSTGDRP